jgi:2-amino-4-hydroxy-6-hydroxymethyldihydropteridine diphosphokinase
VEETAVTDGLPVVYLALGSNLGNRRRNLAVALQRLGPLVRIEAVSSLYETAPEGNEDQAAFLNAVCRGVTGLPARGLLRHLQEIEREIGRRRGERWGPRPIDIDLLLYGSDVIDEDGLRVPHPEMAKRAFVLAPLAEIAPDELHPELGRTISELLAGASQGGVGQVEDQGWEKG